MCKNDRCQPVSRQYFHITKEPGTIRFCYEFKHVIIQEKGQHDMNIDFDKSINVFTDASLTTVNGVNVSCSGYAIVYNSQITGANFRILCVPACVHMEDLQHVQ